MTDCTLSGHDDLIEQCVECSGDICPDCDADVLLCAAGSWHHVRCHMVDFCDYCVTDHWEQYAIAVDKDERGLAL